MVETLLSSVRFGSTVRASLLLGALGIAGCGADPGAQEPGVQTPGAEQSGSAKVEGPLGATKQAVQNGTTLPFDDYSGIVRLWTVNSRFNELRQYCAGVLWKNNVVLTAKHCLFLPAEALNYGFSDVSGDTSKVIASTDQIGFAALGVGAAIAAPGGRDLGAFRLNGTLPVRAFGQIKTSGWTHPVLTTSPNNYVDDVIGYGPTSPASGNSTICSYVSLETGQRSKGCLFDPFTANYGQGRSFVSGTQILSLGVTSTGGDSGGPTLLFEVYATSLADFPLLGVNSLAWKCVPLDSNNCGAVSERVDDLGSWLRTL